MKIDNNLPELSKEGHVLYITYAFHSTISGSTIVNRNLLKLFDSRSFTIITQKNLGEAIVQSEFPNVKNILFRYSKLGRYNRLFIKMQYVISKRLLIKYALKSNTKIIIATNPDIYMLSLAKDVAKKMKLKFYPYLHDTIYEAYVGTPYVNYALKLQNDVFRLATKIFVISEGLAKLYKEKYNQETIIVRHTYKQEEEINEIKWMPGGDFFWSGGIYDINKYSLKLFTKLIANTNIRLNITTNSDTNYLTKIGLNLSNVNLAYYQKFSDYYNYLLKSNLLLIVLDSTQHSKTHYDEIRTIFPTKTLDYLASGIPIVVICPEDYFIARFFHENNCGFCYSKVEDYSDILRIVEYINAHEDEVKLKVENAFKILKDHFANEVVQKTLISAMI